MRWFVGWLGLVGAGCTDGDGKDEPVGADDTDVIDTDVVDTDADTDVVDTDVVDTDVVDTDVVDTDDREGRTPAGVYTVQPELDVVMGGAAQDFGPYSRVHQIVPAVELPEGRMVISEVRLRRATGGAAQDTMTSVALFELWLGTAAVSILVPTFADNLLGEPVLGFSGPVSVAANTGDTLAFDDVILPIDPPFTYDPADGALLLDFRMPTEAPNVLFDCRNDASMYLAISRTEGLPTEGPIASGCGYAFQMVVD
jgi:hypothetical protein